MSGPKPQIGLALPTVEEDSRLRERASGAVKTDDPTSFVDLGLFGLGLMLLAFVRLLLSIWNLPMLLIEN